MMKSVPNTRFSVFVMSVDFEVFRGVIFPLNGYLRDANLPARVISLVHLCYISER